MASGGQGLKAFVSESEIEDKKKKRQEEWERVRKPEDPQDCPEEEYDPRTLFEKLQEQKDTKQAEFEEQFKFKNMVRGLDDEETEFLEEVSQKQQELEKSKMKEEKELLDQFKNRVVSVADDTDKKKPDQSKPSNSSATAGNRQASLLAGAVKRKRQTSDETEPIAKKTDGLVSAGDADRNKPDNSIPERLNQSQETHLPIKGTLQNGVECIGILPGIGFYAHSSDESSNSDSSDEDLTEIIGTVHRGKKGH
ncbi:PSME3-interacting protein-like [Apostichopus japonicus]|uniref:PSME3-interacting protein-like n=1 Tax=Stichopus japonicus TaxID=307972 RepID=UPI003AB2FF33